jgi:hypothetical protein
LTARIRERFETPKSVKYHALVQQLHRSTGIRNPAKRILIVCEDTKSAPRYLEELKQHLRLSATSVSVVDSKSYTQPKQVVERAIKEKAKAAQEEERDGLPRYHACYAVIDGDYGNKVKAARKLAFENGIELIVSTPCFETWVLFHVAHWDTSVAKCKDVIHELKKHLPEYHKGSFSYGQLVARHNEARIRAEKLRRATTLPEEQNPCSDMYKMLTKLLEICADADQESKKTATPAVRK